MVSKMVVQRALTTDRLKDVVMAARKVD